MSPATCPKCNTALKQIYINLEETLLLCPSEICDYPLKESDINEFIQFQPQTELNIYQVKTKQPQRESEMEKWTGILEVLKHMDDEETMGRNFEPYNYRLTVKNLKSLLPGEWISEDVINVLLYRQCRENDKVKYLPTFWSQRFLKEQDGTHWRFTEEFLQDMKNQAFTYITPLLVSNTHWLLCIIDPQAVCRLVNFLMNSGDLAYFGQSSRRRKYTQ